MKEYCIQYGKFTSLKNLRDALQTEFKIKNRARDLPTISNISRFLKNWSYAKDVDARRRKQRVRSMDKRVKFRSIVSKALKERPNESYRKMTARLSRNHGKVSAMTLWKIKRHDLKMYPFRQKKTQALNHQDKNKRMEFSLRVSTIKIDGEFLIDNMIRNYWFTDETYIEFQPPFNPKNNVFYAKKGSGGPADGSDLWQATSHPSKFHIFA